LFSTPVRRGRGAIAIPMHDGIDAFCRAILTGNDKNKPVAP
jgi:hypothetical protein